jgi:hypothetical protein
VDGEWFYWLVIVTFRGFMQWTTDTCQPNSIYMPCSEIPSVYNFFFLGWYDCTDSSVEYVIHSVGISYGDYEMYTSTESFIMTNGK